MDEDYRNRFRQPDAPIGGSPQPIYYQQPANQTPVTDLRQPPQANPQFMAPQSTDQPAYQPTPVNLPSSPTPNANLAISPEAENKTKRLSKIPIIIGGFLIFGAIAFGLFKHLSTTKTKPTGYFPASVNSAKVSIPVYYPVGLSADYKIGGYKVVKQNIVNYAVTNKNNENFYINIQSTPAGYDFTAFNKNFKSPVTYTTTIGTDTIGIMGNQLIGSVVTNTKSWITINTTAIKNAQDMQTITKSLRNVPL